jgi:mannose-1-phosphate guanylyltransferase
MPEIQLYESWKKVGAWAALLTAEKRNDVKEVGEGESRVCEDRSCKY